jgi:diaminopimelate epimerase
MTRALRFTKMQGLGNDFVVLDGVRDKIDLDSAQLRALADRHFGVGCDQILLVEPARRPDTDFRYRIFNADGGEVEQCGNGARCFVHFVREHGLTDKSRLRVETAGGIIEPSIDADGQVTVDMGVPQFEPGRIPFVGGTGGVAEPLEVAGTTVLVSALSLGNPHAVQQVQSVDAAPVEAQGPLIETHPRFPRRVNVGYMQVVDRANIRLRVWERGVGETLACGTGACAAVVAGVRRGLLDSAVRVATRGGTLSVAWDGGGSPVRMTGPAETVFEGEWSVPER